MITVHIEPDNETLTFDRLNSGLQLLNRLGLLRTQALIIRNGELITWDRKFKPGDEITLKKITSVG